MNKKIKIYPLNYYLRIGLMLIIRKVFTILCLLYLSESREYPISLQNKSVSSLSNECPRIFCSWPNFCMGVMLNIMKVFIILFLLYLWEQGIPWKFLKQISKLSFQQFNVKVYSLLDQTEGERKAFLEDSRRGPHYKITPRSTQLS